MQIGSRTVQSLNNAYAILSHLYIDADGSPHAYAPPGSGLIGLDYLANAGHPGNWWGIVTVGGSPHIQGPSDPAPGYYISTTALENPAHPPISCARYLDSEKIPFVVIPGHPNFGIELGDVGMAFHLPSGDSSAFIVGDIGPSNQFGEGSIALAKNLNINTNARSGGTEALGIVYLFFDDSSIGFPTGGYDQILQVANARYLALGGLDYLKANLALFSWNKFLA